MTNDPYAAGILAAIHGWPVCPYTGWHHQRDWWAGYKDQRRAEIRAARHRQPGKQRERKVA